MRSLRKKNLILFPLLWVFASQASLAGVGEAKNFYSGFSDCLRVLGARGHSQQAVHELVAWLDGYYSPDKNHGLRVQVLSVSPEQKAIIFQVSGGEYHSMRGTPDTESGFVYHRDSKKWTHLWEGDKDAYGNTFVWPADGTNLILKRQYDPPSHTVWLDEFPFQVPYQGKAGSQWQMIDTKTGEIVVPIRYRPDHFSTPFAMRDSGRAVNSGEVIWSRDGRNFVEFDEQGVHLFSVQLTADGYQTDRDLDLSYPVAISLLKETPNGRVLFGDPNLNRLRDLLRTLQVP